LNTTLLIVETDIFEHRQGKPHFINACCFGEDFAAWLIQEISQASPDFRLSAPMQEDYGWGFRAGNGKHSFWVAVSYVGDGPQDAPAQWMISVVPSRGLKILDRSSDRNMEEALGRLRDSVREAITSKTGIRVLSVPKDDS